MSSSLVAMPREGALVSTQWDTPENRELILRTVAPGLTEAEARVFFHVARERHLDPLQKQIYAIKRNTWVQEANNGQGGHEQRMTLQVGIEGFRSIANRTGLYMPSDKLPLVEGQGTEHLRVTVWVRKFHKDSNQWMEFGATAYYREYVQVKKDKASGKLEPVSMWAKMPLSQTEKCFAPETEILTERGFQRFDSLKDRVLQVRDNGLEAVSVAAFSRDYAGPMIQIDNDMLNFSVTPNHDMVTTLGKVEVGALYATADTTTRSPWKIPMAMIDSTEPVDVLDEDLELLGYILADGYCSHGGKRFSCSVSRPYKIAALQAMNADSVGVQHSRGDVAIAEYREIRSNFDKRIFSFDASRVSRFVDARKYPTECVYLLNGPQSRIVIDAWQKFDGHTNKKTGVRRIYTSRPEFCGLIEVLAVKAGYSISQRKSRTSDISDKENFYYTISDVEPITVKKPCGSRRGIFINPRNESGKVWCVTVPSGRIIVRRHGFSMVCGNCAEAKVLRRGWPEELGGMYAPEEIQRDPDPEVLPPSLQKKQSKIERDLGTMTTSASPNRGHGNEGTERTTRAETTICSECRQPNGQHAEDCKQSLKNRAKGQRKDTGTKIDRRTQWDTAEGHDPAKHITFDEFIQLCDVQKKLGIKDEVLKNFLDGEFDIHSRSQIRKDEFQKVLDALAQVYPQRAEEVQEPAQEEGGGFDLKP